MSYLIDLNKKYERFKIVLKERNRLREMEREIKRKFPYCQNLSLDHTMKSVESLNETLSKPVEKNLKLYLNHSGTYSFDEKKRRNEEKLNAVKTNMLNYIKGLTIKKFDGDEFLKRKQEKFNKVIKKKSETIKNRKKKAIETIETVNRRMMERKNSRNSIRIKEEFEMKIKEIEKKEKQDAERLEKEHEKIIKKMEEFNEKREEYKEKVEKTRIAIKNQEERNFINRLITLEKKSNFLDKKKEEMISKTLKNKSVHDERIEEVKERAIEREKQEIEAKMQDYLDKFKEKYEKSCKKREELLKKKLTVHTLEDQNAVETVKHNREKMKERYKNKEEYFKKKLNNDSEKVKRAQNIKEFIRRKTVNEEVEKFKKFRENKEEQDEILNLKRKSVILKEIQSKKKVEFVRKENDFVVEERRDYNTKLIKYRDTILDKIKV